MAETTLSTWQYIHACIVRPILVYNREKEEEEDNFLEEGILLVYGQMRSLTSLKQSL